MKKETGIAVFLGIAAGIAIALFVILGTRGAQKSPSGIIQGNSTTPTVAPISQSLTALTILEPVDELTTEASVITIKGKAQKNSLIVIQSPAGEKVLKNDSETFSAEVPLSEGENQIRITSYSQKNTDSHSIVIYSLPK